MSFNFWLSQGLGIIALILVCLSYQFNNKVKFLALQIIANAFYSASFLALNILVGGINTIISLIRVAILFLYERKDLAPPKFLYLAFFLLYIISGIICWQTPIDVISIISFEIFNIAMFVRNIYMTRLLMILPNFMIAIYNLLLMTYTNALLDFIEITVLIFAIFKFRKKNDVKKLKFLI